MTASSPLRALLVIAPLAAAFLTFGCQQASKTSTATPTSPAAPAAPGIQAGEAVAFSNDPQAAISQAASDNKIVMVDVYTDWCTWCKKLDKDVYANPKVGAALEKDFVALKVNPEKNDAAFVKPFKVEGFPTILFLNGKGKEIHRIVGYVPADQFLKELETAREKAASA